jgi:hypothetical protein|tara:strand:- start:266 stop:391 length:126 start_codon:yes stop_codon:yes gene_type:complete
VPEDFQGTGEESSDCAGVEIDIELLATKTKQASSIPNDASQ